MTKSRSDSSRSFFPEHIKRFFARRVFDIASLSLMVLAGFWMMSLLSYTPADASFNSAATQMTTDIQNWGGTYGAYISDVMIQSLGYGAVMLGVPVFLWGFRLFKRRASALPLSIRISCALLSVFGFAIALSPLQQGNETDILYWGGAIGHAFMGGMTHILPPAIGKGSILFISLMSLCGAMICFGLSLGFTRAAWQKALHNISALCAHAFKLGVYYVQTIYSWLRHYDGLEDNKPKKPVIPTSVTKPKVDKEPSYKAPHSPQIINPTPAAVPAADTPFKNVQIVAPVAASANDSASAKSTKQKRISFEELGEWETPPADMLQEAKAADLELRLDEKALQRNADMLQQVLTDFGVDGEIVKIRPGPVVTLYELEPAAGVKSSKVIGLSDDIARSMSAISVRAAVVPGRSVIGIEIPNQNRQIVYLRSLIESRDYDKTKASLPLVLGKDIGGGPVIADLAKMPHLLIAGTTGAGKSVAVNTMILSLLYQLSPEQCRMIMIDPKMLELSVYDDIPHLLSPVVTDPGRAVVALKWAVQEMENRYRSMSKFGVRNIDGYNTKIRDAIAKGENMTRKIQTGYDPESGKPVFEDEHIDLVELPYIVIIVDEFADLMLVAGKDVESAIQRLAQMARAAGIHLIMATQRPSVDVITGVIKANFPTRISFQVTSKFDSRTILGEGGAEQLLGMGDMLYMAAGGRIQRVHGPFVDDREVEKVVEFVKEQGEPDYLNDVTDGAANGLPGLFDGVEGSGGGSDVDDMYDEAVALVAREGKASTSFIQRHLQIGYNRAARIIEEMEKQGVVGPANHVGKREILVGDHSTQSVAGG